MARKFMLLHGDCLHDAPGDTAEEREALLARIATLEAALRPYAACSCTSGLHTGTRCADSVVPREQWCDVCVVRAALAQEVEEQ